MALSKQVSDQLERNNFVKNEISVLDGQIKEIDELQKRREELLARMQVIQDLQGRRPVIVRVFDEMVRAIPDGVYFRELERTGDTFKIIGVAESANQVSNLMRNLESSQWFRSPVLSTVAADQQKTTGSGKQAAPVKPVDGKSGSNKFELTVELEAPGQPEAKEAEPAVKGGKK